MLTLSSICQRKRNTINKIGIKNTIYTKSPFITYSKNKDNINNTININNIQSNCPCGSGKKYKKCCGQSE